MDRGVVLSPDFQFLPNGKTFFKSAVDSDELRKYLLYWDKIDVPLTKKVLFECNDYDFLISAGVLQRTPYSKTNVTWIALRECYCTTLPKYAGDEILSAHEYVFHQLCQKEPGKWSKAQFSASLMSKNELSRECVEIELYNSLPVPNSSTPLSNILEFKEKRSDELISFRIHLDEIYQKIISSVDIPRAKNTELVRLELSIKDVYRVLNESKIRTTLRSLKSVISGVDGIFGVLASVASAPFIPFSPLIAGVAVAGLSVAGKMVMHNQDTIPHEFTYLKSVHRHF